MPDATTQWCDEELPGQPLHLYHFPLSVILLPMPTFKYSWEIAMMNNNNEFGILLKYTAWSIKQQQEVESKKVLDVNKITIYGREF